MRSPIVLTAAVAALACAGATALLAHDAGGHERIAPGTQVAGVEVGGMDEDRARSAVARARGAPLAHPLTLQHGSRRFRVEPAALEVRFDAEGLAAEALRRSRQGNPFGRALRDLTGDDAGIRLGPRVTYSRQRFAELVREVRRAIGRPARNADVDFTRRGLRLVRARNGRTVLEDRLERKIASALADPRADRTIDIPVRVTRRPRRTLAELRDRYPRVIAVSRPREELRFYRRLHLVQRYPVAIGRAGYETKAGRYEVQSLQKDPAWHAPDKKWAGEFAGKTVPPGSPDNPLKARWIGFTTGAGIHGTAETASLGGRASHGCIRMSVRGVKDLYRRVRLGTPVFIL
jgi:lipoprotein-anchoring transpeptidase ErfK/SrfK